MKNTLMCFALGCACVAGALEGPSVYKMTEAQLLDVAKSGALDDRMTACQELAHRGTAASVPVLAEMLKSGEPSVFHSALYALQNIPGAEVDAALAAAEAQVPDAASTSAGNADMSPLRIAVLGGNAVSASVAPAYFSNANTFPARAARTCAIAWRADSGRATLVAAAASAASTSAPGMFWSA